MSINPIYYTEDIKKIERIEFTIFRNKDIKQYSAISEDPFGINLSESYENYEPKKGGLVDLRLGTCDIYLPCMTCGENSLECPGHFGHTELAEPVFHFGFLNHLKNILQCICLKCSNILIDKSQHNIKKILNKKPEFRFKEIKLLTKPVNYCFYCGVPVSKIKREVKDNGSIKIIVEHASNGTATTENEDMQNIMKKIKETLSPRDCYNILRNISDQDCYLLGFNSKIHRPEDLIIDKFPIPPVIIRPTAKVDFMSATTMEDSLTLKISDIITANKRVRQQIEKNVLFNELSTYNQDIFNLLQYHIATYFDNDSVSLPRTEFKTGGRLTKSISDRIKGKTGRVRSNLMGKRVDFSARTVITSDPYIDIDQVGVPKKIAMELTIPEEVTPYNIKYLTELVKCGRDNYPGANFVLRVMYKDGKIDIQKIDLKYRKKAIRLNYGDIVERHIIDNDYVLFNRQPTLHKPSMMGHKIQVINNDNLNTFRMNVSVCKPYNADFDGDEMNIHLGQTIQARNEIKRIANVQYQIIGSKDSSPIIGCQQDTLSGAYMLSDKSVKLKGWEIANILCTTTSETKTQILMDKEYSGHEIFSHIIPKGINILKKHDDTISFQIDDGIFKKGFLDKTLLSFSKNSLIHFIWDKFSSNKTRRFIDDTQKLILNYLLLRGQTIGFKDALLDEDMHNKIDQIVNTQLLKSKYNITQFENDIKGLSLDIIETTLMGELAPMQANIGQILMSHLNSDNFFWIAAKSGARGSATNIAQISGVIGLLILNGSRIKKSIENRSMIYFHKDDDTPEARGFIKNSFLKGLEGHELFINASAGRESLIDTAIKTAQTGYIQRQLIKGLEDLSIKYDHTNRNAKGIIIQTIYGESGINQSTQTELLLKIILMDNESIKQNFGFNQKELDKLAKTKFKSIYKDKEIKTSYDSIAEFNDRYIQKLKKYRDDLRNIQTNALLNYKIIEEKYVLPVNLFRIIQDYTHHRECLELSPMEIIEAIETFLTDYDNRLITSLKPGDKYMIKDDRCMKYLLEIALNEYLAPKKCIFEYGLTKAEFICMMEEIKFNFIKAIVEPGEMVGIIAAQSIGEPTSQFSLTANSKIKLISVSSESKITVISTKIGKFCDNLINQFPELTYQTESNLPDSIETDISKLPTQYYIIGVNSNEKTFWNKISHISRHPVNGNMMKIITKSGRIVHTTLGHSHLIRKNQTVQPIVGSEIRVGMRIPVARYIDLIYEQQYIEFDNQQYELDYLFGWFIGLYLAKGYIENNKIYLKKIPNSFIKNIKLITAKFKIDSNIKHNINCDITDEISLNSLPKFIFSLCKSKKKSLPDIAFLAPKEFKIGLLQAYCDSNNIFDTDKIVIYSSNEQLITDISFLFAYFGICGSISILSNNISVESSKRATEIKDFSSRFKNAPLRCTTKDKVESCTISNLTETFFSNKDFTTTNIYTLNFDARYATLYKNNIGTLLYNDKLNELIDHLQNSYNLSTEIDKINDLYGIIMHCNQILNCNITVSDNDELSRQQLIKYIKIFESHECKNKIKQELKLLNQAADSNIIWDEIIEINIYTPNQTDNVYDFTVPLNETFMIDNGIIVHNTLNTKHSAGSAKNYANMGISRIQELLHYSKNIKTPQMTIYFKKPYNTNRSQVNKIVSYFKYLSIRYLVSNIEIYYDLGLDDALSKKLKNDNVANPFFINNQKVELYSMPFVFRLKMDIEKMLDKETTLLDIKTKFISHWYKNYNNLKNLKKNEKEIITSISRAAILSNNISNKDQYIHIRFSMNTFNYNIITDFLKMICDDITLKGIENISNIDIVQERCVTFDKNTGKINIDKEYVVYTSGINLERLRYMKGIDFTRTKCNDIAKTLKLYGIEATRQILLHEFFLTYQSGGTNINYTHLSLLVDQMCHLGEIISIDRHGLSKIDIDPIARASFEKTMDHFINAAIFNENDHMKSVSSRIAIGRVIPGGTGAFDLFLDTKKLENSEYTENESGGKITFAPLEEEPLIKDLMKYNLGKHDFFIP